MQKKSEQEATQSLVVTKQPELGLPTLVKLVTASLHSPHSVRAYTHALNDFFLWYQAEGQPTLCKEVIELYLQGLSESSSSTYNQRLAAIRKMIRSGVQHGSFPEELLVTVERIKGSPQRGQRTGVWLTIEEAQALINAPPVDTLKGKRDRAILAVLIGSGLRRAEVANLSFSHFRFLDDRWVITDIIGKRNKFRSVPIPLWAKQFVDVWSLASGVMSGRVFRGLTKHDTLIKASTKITAQTVRNVVVEYSRFLKKVAPHDLRRTFAKLAHKGGSPIDQIQLSLGHDSIQTTEKYLGVEQDLTDAPCDHLGLKISG